MLLPPYHQRPTPQSGGRRRRSSRAPPPAFLFSPYFVPTTTATDTSSSYARNTFCSCASSYGPSPVFAQTTLPSLRAAISSIAPREYT